MAQEKYVSKTFPVQLPRRCEEALEQIVQETRYSKPDIIADAVEILAENMEKYKERTKNK